MACSRVTSPRSNNCARIRALVGLPARKLKGMAKRLAPNSISKLEIKKNGNKIGKTLLPNNNIPLRALVTNAVTSQNAKKMNTTQHAVVAVIASLRSNPTADALFSFDTLYKDVVIKLNITFRGYK